MILAIQVSEPVLENLREAGLTVLSVGSEQAGQHPADLIMTESADVLACLRTRGELEEKPIVLLADFSPEISALSNHPLDLLVSASSPEELKWRVVRFLGTCAHLRQLRQKLRSADQELGSLIYAVSHDLRAPIRAISGFSDILANQPRESFSEDARHCLERVCSGTQRLSLMLEDLLGLSRLFREEERLQTFDLSALIRQIGERQRSQEPERELEFLVPDGLVWRADVRLTRMLWESLLENAWKFTSGQSPARIWVEFADETYCVGDNGVGFEMRYAERLFTPFQRMHGAEFSGRGVGLARAARIVSHWGGTIWAQTSPGQGARFFFRLEGLTDAES